MMLLLRKYLTSFLASEISPKFELAKYEKLGTDQDNDDSTRNLFQLRNLKIIFSETNLKGVD
jgi:hypothetical protein